MKRKAISKTGLSVPQREELDKEVDTLVARISRKFGIPQAQIARQAFYRLQKSGTYGVNPTPAQKNASYEHWSGICQQCKKPVARNDESYHHSRRDIANPHQPSNLKPYHDECHDKEEGASKGSLRKGSRRSR